MFSDLYMKNPEGSGSDAALSIIGEQTITLHKNNCSALWQIVVSLARGDNHQQVTTKVGACRKQ